MKDGTNAPGGSPANSKPKPSFLGWERVERGDECRGDAQNQPGSRLAPPPFSGPKGHGCWISPPHNPDPACMKTPTMSPCHDAGPIWRGSPPQSTTERRRFAFHAGQPRRKAKVSADLGWSQAISGQGQKVTSSQPQQVPFNTQPCPFKKPPQCPCRPPPLGPWTTHNSS